MLEGQFGLFTPRKIAPPTHGLRFPTRKPRLRATVSRGRRGSLRWQAVRPSDRLPIVRLQGPPREGTFYQLPNGKPPLNCSRALTENRAFEVVFDFLVVFDFFRRCSGASPSLSSCFSRNGGSAIGFPRKTEKKEIEDWGKEEWK
ncbi:unnamed protein product [Linum trigynum]|uniref:Uncharacterized protein n=1 Tax=Linum trigynum TaxID=586398 RepID=A0AAV2FQC1_9ROSI